MIDVSLPMLQYLCEENGPSGAELDRVLGVARAQASLLLKGERELTAAHTQKGIKMQQILGVPVPAAVLPSDAAPAK